jgi:DNA-binding NtrC family response regulator
MNLGSKGSEQTAEDVRTPRVLLVDDEPGLVSAVVQRLKLRHIYASGVTSGLDALRKAEEEAFDVAILDVRMPDIGGLDMLDQFREKYPHMEIVLMSGHGSSENAKEGVRLGAFEYLQKPVEIDDLVAVIQRAVRGKGEKRRG